MVACHRNGHYSVFGSLHNSGGPNKSATGEQSTITIITYNLPIGRHANHIHEH